MSVHDPLGSRGRWWRNDLRHGAATRHYLLLCVVAVVGCTVWWTRSGLRPGSETSVVLYCAQDQVIAEPLLAAFTRQTGIRVRAVFDSEAVKTVGLANRLLAERDHPVCDVFWGNEELRTRQLAAAGVFLATNGWSAFGHRSRQLVVHTQPPPFPAGPEKTVAFPPRRLTDLTNAAYRGRVSLAFPMFGTTATHLLVLRQHWGLSNWLTWCRALQANAPFLEEGNSQVVRRVARGEAWVGLTDSDDILAAQREGLPVVAVLLGSESLRMPNTVALVAKPGETPAAARSLFGYLQSEEVRQALTNCGALEADAPGGMVLIPDWDPLLRQLEVATGQLVEAFRR